MNGEITTVYNGCFGTTDFREDPTSDLYSKARAAHSDIGQPDPPIHETIFYRLGEIQAQVSNEMKTDLETHVVKEPQQTNNTNYHVNNAAPVANQQIGGENNTANVTQVLTFDSRSVANAITVVRENMDNFPDADRDDVKTYVGEIEDEMAQPTPRPLRVKSALNAIGRVAGAGGLEVVKNVIEGTVAGIMKSLGASG